MLFSIHTYGATIKDEQIALIGTPPARLMYTPLFSKVTSILDFPLGHPKHSPWADPYVHYPPLFCLQPKPHMPVGTQHHFWLGTFHCASLTHHVMEPSTVEKLLRSIHAIIVEANILEWDPLYSKEIRFLGGGEDELKKIRTKDSIAPEPIDISNPENYKLCERIAKSLTELIKKDNIDMVLTPETVATMNLDNIRSGMIMPFMGQSISPMLASLGFLSLTDPARMDYTLCNHATKTPFLELLGLEDHLERGILMKEEDDEEFDLKEFANELETLDEIADELQAHVYKAASDFKAMWENYHTQRFMRGEDIIQVVSKRNVLWLTRIQEYIKTKPKPWLAAVGYEHLPDMLTWLSEDYNVYRFNAAAQTWHPVTPATDWAVLC